MITRLDRRSLMALVERRAGILDLADNPFATAAWTAHFLEQVARDNWEFGAADADGAALLLMYTEPQAPAQAHALTNYYEIDYLTGDDAYKRSWMTQRRARVGVIACNPRTWRGAARAAYELAGAARQRLRQQPASAAQPALAGSQ